MTQLIRSETELHRKKIDVNAESKFVDFNYSQLTVGSIGNKKLNRSSCSIWILLKPPDFSTQITTAQEISKKLEVTYPIRAGARERGCVREDGENAGREGERSREERASEKPGPGHGTGIGGLTPEQRTAVLQPPVHSLSGIGISLQNPFRSGRNSDFVSFR